MSSNEGTGENLTNRYLYNSKELQDDFGLNWYDYGARFYDPEIARFHTLDPLTEDYSFQSPFVYAGNNPVRYIDWNGLGPLDRIRIAYSNLGTPYKKEYTSYLRTANSAKALQYMDCSELVSRVLAGDGITNGVQWKNTSLLVDFFSNKEVFIKSNTPEAGDIFAWVGHTGIVESYDSESKMVTIIHATEYNNISEVVREKYSLDWFEDYGAGFYRPKEENPDILHKTFKGSKLEEFTINDTAPEKRRQGSSHPVLREIINILKNQEMYIRQERKPSPQ